MTDGHDAHVFPLLASLFGRLTGPCREQRELDVDVLIGDLEAPVREQSLERELLTHGLFGLRA